VATLADNLETRLASLPALATIGARRVQIAVQGFGVWTRDAIRPDLTVLQRQLLSRGHPGLRVAYIGLDPNPPVPLDDSYERYLLAYDPADQADLDARLFDLVIVATSDFAHVNNLKDWRRRRETAKLILVEKPFSDSSFDIAEFYEECTGEIDGPEDIQHIFGFDHYLLYISDVLEQADLIDELVGEQPVLEFEMREVGPIEAERLRTLQSGLIFDMGSHFLGLVSLIAGDISIYEGSLRWRGLHKFESYSELSGHVFFAETAATCVLLASEGEELASARFGKAVDSDLKQLRLVGQGASVDIALSSNRSMSLRDQSGGDREIVKVDGSGSCTRHGRLVEGLIAGDTSLFALLLSIEECYKIVRLLEQLRRQSVDLPSYEPGSPEW